MRLRARPTIAYPAGAGSELAPASRGASRAGCGPVAGCGTCRNDSGESGFHPETPKPHVWGFTISNPHPAEFPVRECRTSIGLRATVTTECIGSVYRARYYDPTRSRFVSEDPIRGLLSFSPPVNFYLYASANPIGYRDPSGLLVDPLTVAIAIGAAGGAINAALNGGGVAEIAVGAIIGGGSALVAIGGPQGLIGAAVAGAGIGAGAEIIAQITHSIAAGEGIPRIETSKIIAAAIAGATGAAVGQHAVRVGVPSDVAERIASQVASLLNVVAGITNKLTDPGPSPEPCP